MFTVGSGYIQKPKLNYVQAMSQIADTQMLEWRNPIGIRVAQMQRTGNPLEDFSFGIEGPSKGWLFFHLMLGSSGRFACRVSGNPNDFLLDLIIGLRQVLDGKDASVSMHAEPNTFVIKFLHLENKALSFQLSHHRAFEADDPPELIIGFAIPDFRQIVGSFIYLLKDFIDATDGDLYRKEMHHELPEAHFKSLELLYSSL